MKTKNFIWAALSMTAALVMTACSSDNEVTEAPAAPQPSVKTIPYTVTVGGETTRATVDENNKTLRFAIGDELYVTGTDIKGVLSLKEGDEGKSSAVTFSGDLTYTGSGDPAADLELTATLVSAQQNNGQVIIDDVTGAVTVEYPDDAYCTSVNDAVQQYSCLTGTSTYGSKTFSLSQQTAFLNFVITFEDGTANNTVLSAVVSNGGSAVCTANVTTTTENEKVVAKFVLPVAAGFTLNSASVKMGTKDAVSFGATQTLTGKVYNVTKTIAATYPMVEAVDLGLPSGTKWAPYNVGATSETEYGDFFAWGATEPWYSSYNPLSWKTGKSGYNWGSYHYGTSDSNLTKYNSTDEKTTLDAADDAATANWGPTWRMPTPAEFQELLDNTTKEYVTDYQGSGVPGYTFTRNSKTLFLPAAGYFDGTSHESVGGNDWGEYWTSSLSDNGKKWGRRFYFSPWGIGLQNQVRSFGLAVRAVKKND